MAISLSSPACITCTPSPAGFFVGLPFHYPNDHPVLILRLIEAGERYKYIGHGLVYISNEKRKGLSYFYPAHELGLLTLYYFHDLSLLAATLPSAGINHSYRTVSP